MAEILIMYGDTLGISPLDHVLSLFLELKIKEVHRQRDCRNLEHTISSKTQEIGFIARVFDSVTKLTCDMCSCDIFTNSDI